MTIHKGGDLEEFIRAQNNKPLGEAVILGMFVQICLGLQEVHARYSFPYKGRSFIETSRLPISS